MVTLILNLIVYLNVINNSKYISSNKKNKIVVEPNITKFQVT